MSTLSVSSADHDVDGIEEPAFRRQLRDKVIVTISGTQCAEAVPSVMRLLSLDPDAELTDIGQFVVRNKFLTTALLTTCHPQETVKEILYESQQEKRRDPLFQVEFSYPPISSPGHASTSSLLSLSSPSTEELIITIFSTHSIPLQSLNEITSVLLEYKCRIKSIDKLTKVDDEHMSLQLNVVINDTFINEIKKKLLTLSKSQNNYDLSIQNRNIMKNSKRIIIFDLSWTLIQCDSINLLLNKANTKPDESLQNQFNNNEIRKTEWLRQRVKLLKGFDANLIYTNAIQSLTYTNGAETLCKHLKHKLGYRLAIVSSGCKVIAEAVKSYLDFDFAFGNELEVDSQGNFTGEVVEPTINSDRKAELVDMLAMQERISTEQIVCVGDGPVSSKMLASAGMSIAFDQPGATDDDNHNGFISSRSLTSVLYLLGVTGQD